MDLCSAWNDSARKQDRCASERGRKEQAAGCQKCQFWKSLSTADACAKKKGGKSRRLRQQHLVLQRKIQASFVLEGIQSVLLSKKKKKGGERNSHCDIKNGGKKKRLEVKAQFAVSPGGGLNVSPSVPAGICLLLSEPSSSGMSEIILGLLRLLVDNIAK